MIRVIDARSKTSHRQEISILHVSDPHFRADSATDSAGEFTLPGFEERLVDALAPPSQGIHIICVTGDLVDFEQPDKAKHPVLLHKAKRFFETLTAKHCELGTDGLVVIPGNHDYRWVGNIEMPTAQQEFSATFSQYFQHTLFRFHDFDVLVACFDSNHGHKLDWARGEVNISEFEGLSRDCSALAAQLKNDPFRNLYRIALVHHHPFPVPAADRTIPAGIVEKLIGKPVVGAAEYMLLRNAGVFVERLLESDFRLVLHGHLHQRGYWRVLNQSSGKSEKWIEVVSGASIGAGTEFNFNKSTIYPGGIMKTLEYGWTSERRKLGPATLPTAPYEVVRTWDASAGAASEAASKAYSTFWTLNLANGDLESRDTVRGYRALGKPLDMIRILSTSEGLTSTDFFADKLNGDYSVEALKPTAGRNEPNTAHYNIKFNPPLGSLGLETTCDFMCRYSYRGVMWKSIQDQDASRGVAPEPSSPLNRVEPGWDRLIHTNVRPTDQMVVRIRFIPDPAAKEPWVPHEVFFEVFDDKGSPAPYETHCSHVVFDSFPVRNPDPALAHLTTPDVLLTVHKPRMNYSYVLKWKLGSESNPDPVQLRRIRKAVLQSDRTAEARRKADDLLNTCLALLEPYGATGASADIKAFLFGYEEPKHLLVCKATTGAMDDPLYTSFHYGQDMVGTAFRRREPVLFVRSNKGFEYFRRLKDDGLEYLIACPIRTDQGRGWPVGVVTFASRDEDSRLHECCRSKALVENLCADVANAFDTVQFR